MRLCHFYFIVLRRKTAAGHRTAGRGNIAGVLIQFFERGFAASLLVQPQSEALNRKGASDTMEQVVFSIGNWKLLQRISLALRCRGFHPV